MQALKVITSFLQGKYCFPFKSSAALFAHQQKLLKKMQKKVLPHSPLYKSLLESPFHTWPLMNKQRMMAQFNQLNTRGLDKQQLMDFALQAENTRNFKPMLKDMTVGLSSGTSGNRGLFIVNSSERATWLGYILAKVLPQYFFKKCKIAFFLRANSNLYTSVQKRKHIIFQFFDLLIDFDKHLDSLNQYQPDILIAPAQVLKLLAHAQEKEKLNIAPSKIISVAEVLDESSKRYIQQIFQKAVDQIYQCTEGFLGVTCSEGTLHINEEWIFLEKEWLDVEKTRFIPIITDLIRESQPIIRYRLDDILTLKKEKCACGSPNLAIEKIEGRCDEILYLPSKEDKRLIKIFPDYITRAIANASSKIEQFYVEQNELRHWTLALNNLSDEIQQKVLQQIQALCHRTGTKQPAIQFQLYTPQPIHQKLKRIHRAVHIEEVERP
jgi:putative adenylate-forming enzyme